MAISTYEEQILINNVNQQYNMSHIITIIWREAISCLSLENVYSITH